MLMGARLQPQQQQGQQEQEVQQQQGAAAAGNRGTRGQRWDHLPAAWSTLQPTQRGVLGVEVWRSSAVM